MKISHKIAGLATVACLSLSLAACGSSDNADPAPAPTTSTSDTPSATPDAPAADNAAADVFGPGCAAVPEGGKGSFNGMATDPVATAASNNPLLSTLVKAVGIAGLGDTLNTADGITVFAPTNDAFGKIDPATLKSVLADKATLTKILTNHVVAGKIAPADLAGTHKTLDGGTITIKGSGEEFTVDSKSAQNVNVICGNVPTANATVYIIDGVLLP